MHQEPARTTCSSRRPHTSRNGGLGAALLVRSVERGRRFALNPVSEGTAVTMGRVVPRFTGAPRCHGPDMVELDTTESAKGGGGVRRTALAPLLWEAHPATAPGGGDIGPGTT